MTNKYVSAILAFACGSLLQKSLCVRRGSEENDLATGSQLTIVEEPKSMTSISGAASELRCEVFGAPVPTVQWLHNGKVIRMGEKPFPYKSPLDTGSPLMAERLRNRGRRTFQMATTSSKLTIPCVDKRRTGLYTCLASNGRETLMANATVRLEEKGNALWNTVRCLRKRSEQTLLGSPAEIYLWTESRMERPGVSVQLMCRASGVPTPKISWYESSGSGAPDDGQRRTLVGPDDDRFTVLSNGDLLIKKTTAGSPMSMYQCEAVNEFGKNEVTVMLLQILDDISSEVQLEGGKSNGKTERETPNEPRSLFVNSEMSA